MSKTSEEELVERARYEQACRIDRQTRLLNPDYRKEWLQQEIETLRMPKIRLTNNQQGEK